MIAPRGSRAYRLLLRAFPGEFRARFGADMETLFAERLRDAGRSPVAWLRVWLHGTADVLQHAFVEHWSGRRSFSVRTLTMESLIQDLRFAVRGLVRSPGFAVVAVVTVALGVGPNTAMFSILNAVLLRPLPYAEPERLVTVWPEAGFNTTLLERVAGVVPALESITGVSIWTLTVSGDGEPEEVMALFVSPNHFDVLGVRPLLGRGFAPQEGEPGRGDVAVLSHDFWQTRYGGSPSIIGQRIRLAGPTHASHEVVGVMGPEHRAVASEPAAWVPLEKLPGATLATDHTWWINLRIGRLAAGATDEQAEAQLRAVAPLLRAEVPTVINEEQARSATTPALQEHTVGRLRGTLWLLLGAVGLVLLIACVNVANLLLARGEARARELALRRALGAGKGRLLRQLFTEALVLAVVGGAAGVLMAHVLLRLMLMQAPPDLPELASVRLDAAVLGFALLASCAGALVFGAAPAFQARRAQALSVARQGGKGTVGSGTRSGVSALLVTIEVALAVVLVVGSGLMLRTLGKLYDVDPGFRAEGVLVLRPNPLSTRYAGGAAYHRFYAEVLERVRALPGVESVAGINIRPVTTDNWSWPMFAEDHPVAPGASPPSHNVRVVTPGYFETLRIPLVQGRSFNESDRADAPAVAVVNRAFVARFWPGADPLGKQLRFFTPHGTPHRIVGVVGDVHQQALDIPPSPEMYVPHAQIPWQVALWIMVRTRSGEPMSLGSAVKEAVWSLDSETPIAQMEPLQRVVGRSAAMTRFLTLSLGFFGVLALTLGAVGVYGVTSYVIARRLPEFGVRLALGATARDLVGSALVQGGAPVAFGIALGSLAAFSLTGLLRSLLFGISPRDPFTFGAVLVLLALVGVLALLIPALRATRADPISVLRHE